MSRICANLTTRDESDREYARLYDALVTTAREAGDHITADTLQRDRSAFFDRVAADTTVIVPWYEDWADYD